MKDEEKIQQFLDEKQKQVKSKTKPYTLYQINRYTMQYSYSKRI